MLVRDNETKGVLQRSGFPNFLEPTEGNNPVSTEILCGCCCYRKAVFSQHYFDEMFEGYGLMEDVEFSYRVSKTNQLVVNPRAHYIHNHSPTDRISLRKNFEMRIFNHFYIFSKHINHRTYDWVFFWWSHIGVIFLSVYHALVSKSFHPIKGVYDGHRKLVQKIRKN